MFGSVYGRGFAPAAISDARKALDAADIHAYYSLKPTVSGAQASASMSPFLVGQGTTVPTVTLEGPLSPPREISIDYPVGGARGTATYRIALDGNTTVLTGATSSAKVDIGSGNFITFGNDANYTINTVFATATIHKSKIVNWTELTGQANCTLTDTLSTKGHRYEAFGLNGRWPSLYMWTSALDNITGLPAKFTGIDIQFEVWMLYETWTQINDANAMVPWAFTNSSDATKSVIDGVFTGPTHATQTRAIGINRKDSGAVPLTASLFTDTYRTDLAAHVHRFVVTNSGNIYTDNQKGKAANASLNRGVATNVDRFTLGGIKQGASAFLASGWCSGRITELLFTAPLSDDKAFRTACAMAAA